MAKGKTARRRSAPTKGKPAPKARAPQLTQRVITRYLRASYDAAQTNDGNRQHWAATDALSAQAANDLATRKKLRERARYEIANNSYAKGITLTKSNSIFGAGPKLQVNSPDATLNTAVETAWGLWAGAVRLADRLRLMGLAKCGDGETFCLLATNGAVKHPVKLDPIVIECDQVTSPYLASFDPRSVDGVHFDAFGQPEWYDVLRQHPGNPLATPEYDKVPAARLLHWFRADRPLQFRGVPEITAALPLFALLRRFMLATVTAAETAASFAAVLEDPNGVRLADESPDPMETLEIVRGMMTTLYGGQKLSQLKAEHPSTTIDMFVTVLIREIARCLNMPWNLAIGDSSKANYSSARLDHMIFRQAIGVERQDCAAEVLDPLLEVFLSEAVLIPGLLPESIRSFGSLPHQWIWPAWDYLDPLTEAQADTERLTNGTTTLADICAQRSGNWQEVMRQQAREKAFRIQAERDAGAVAGGIPTAGADAAGADVQATALNGAQIASLLAIADKLALKQYSPEAVDAMLRASFPAIAPSLIAEIVNGLKLSDPPAPTAPASGPTQASFALQAAAGRTRSLKLTTVPVKLLKAQAGAPEPPATSTLPRFEMVAYTGGAMHLEGFAHPVVIDLSTLNIPSQERPVLRGHRDWKLIGHTEQIVNDGQQLLARGVISGVGDEAREVIRSAKNKFPWQASVGVAGPAPEFIAAGLTAEANGRTWSGPCYIARGFTLNEISFVPLGADGNTSARIAAQGGLAMNFEQWLLQFYTIDEITALDAAVKEALQKVFAAEYPETEGEDPSAPPADPPMPGAAAPITPVAASGSARRPRRRPPVTPPASTLSQDQVTQLRAQLRQEAAAEVARQNAIRRICAGQPDSLVEVQLDGKAVKVNLLEHAIQHGWTANETELHVLRASRPQAAPFMFARSGVPAVTDVTIEAALCRTLRIRDLEKQFKPEVLEAADRQFRTIGLQQVMLIAAAHNGYEVGPGMRITTGNVRHVLQAAFGRVNLQAGWTPISLPGIFANTANKEILQGYMEEDQSWQKIGAVKTVTDFKSVTSYRLLDSMEYEQVGPGGEIKHGKLGEESYTRQANTYAKMLALTRQDIINDDLGAFDDLKARLGRGAAQKFNNVFWTEFLSDASTFWTTTRTNYITGATTNLGTDGVGLGLGVKAFRQMRSPSADDGSKRIAGRPEILLVPPELETIADGLYQGKNLASVKVSDGNTHAGKYEPVVSPWLSDSAFTGYSTTAWYLLRNPAIAAAVVASFLNGQQTPTIEDAEADFNVLGVQFRGYHDFGVDQAEYLCGVKSKGAA